jgi:murein peptide amidase A
LKYWISCWLAVVLLTTAGTAEPTIYSVDADGNGWLKWTSEAFPDILYPSPGLVVVALSETQSLDWLVEEAENYPESSAVQSALARRLWAEGRREESLRAWEKAEEAHESDLLLESASFFYRENQWGHAFRLLSQAGADWLALYAPVLEQNPVTARLKAVGWEVDPELPVLRKGETTLKLESVDTNVRRIVKLGRHEVQRDHQNMALVLPELGLQMRVSSLKELDSLAGDLAGDEGVSQQLGFSVEGRPIMGYWLGSGPEVVLYFGAFHGDEPESFSVLNEFLNYLRSHPELLEGRTAVIVPAVNPDGLSRLERRNARGVDLNRNYPTSNWTSEGKGTDYWGGKEPASEPETKIVMDLMARFQPDRIVSIHCPYKCVNFDGPAERLAKAMSAENGYKVEPSIGYPTPGSFGNYAGVEGKIPTITLELPPVGEEDVWADNRTALVRALRG